MKAMRKFLVSMMFMVGLTSSASAVDFSVPVLDQDDNQIAECLEPVNVSPQDINCKSRRVLTLGLLVFRALTVPEPGLPPEEGVKRGKLGLDVYKAKDLTLTAEDIALIKKQVAKAFNPLIVVRIYQMVDPGFK